MPNTPPLTAETITAKQIRTLRAEAAETGDLKQIEICDRALSASPIESVSLLVGGETVIVEVDAREICADIINDAETQPTWNYTTFGSVRLGCGHAHPTLKLADACLKRDQKLCSGSARSALARRGGYSDRKIYRTEAMEPNPRNLQDCADLTQADRDALNALDQERAAEEGAREMRGW